MNNLNFPILSILIFLPVAGAALLLLINRSNENLHKWLSLSEYSGVYYFHPFVHRVQ